MALSILIDNFEGPFDLLCHLLDENKFDIYDIPIAEITRQYLAYLDAMAELDLDIASEFLVLAATLINIKTKMLLPKRPKPEEGEFSDDYFEDEDPRAGLVQQLLEYKKYKELAGSLEDMLLSRSRQFVHPNEEEAYVALLHDDVVYKGISVQRLGEAMERVLEQQKNRNLVHNIRRENITIDNRISFILAQLKANPRGVRFDSLFAEDCDRLRLIVLFLALLELIRRGNIVVLQKQNCGEILIFPGDEVKKL